MRETGAGVLVKSGFDGVQARVVANELRSEAWQSAVGMAAIIAATSYLHISFADRVAPQILWPWLLVMYAGVAVWFTSLTVLTLRRPAEGEIVAVWIPLARGLMSIFNLAITAGVWIFMPASDPGMQMVIVLLLVWFVTTQLLGSTEATQVALPAILGVIGSLILYFLVTPGPNRPALIAFLVAFGATSMALRGFIRASVIRSVEARVLSERAAGILQQALDVTAAERDAKTRFLQSATHDLQQPVQAASLYFDNALAADTPEERDRAAVGARNAFTSTRTLLEHMLEHLRLEAGAVQLRPVPLPLGPLIAAVAREHEPAARAAGVTLRVVPTRLEAVADAPALSRALGNLIGNAVKHARGERVLIGARRRSADEIDLWVIDDGEGIPASEADGLFEDFAQGSASAGRGGFGLGLSSVRRIAILLGGAAGLDRRWTGGCAFYIRLPGAGLRRADHRQTPRIRTADAPKPMIQAGRS